MIRMAYTISFVVKLDNTELEDYLKEGLSTVPIPEIIKEGGPLLLRIALQKSKGKK